MRNSTKRLSPNWRGTVKCHKSRITLWEKAILQPKKNQKSADIKQSINIYEPGNFKLINFLKFT